MRLLLALLLVLPYNLHAQRCGGSHTLEVRMSRPVFAQGRWMATAELSGTRADQGQVDSVPGDPQLLRLRVHSGCGLEQVTWTIHDHFTANRMVVHLYHLPGDAPTVHMRIPFTGYYTQHYDLPAIMRCATDQQRLREGATDTIACRGGLGLYTRLGYDGLFDVMDTRPWETEQRTVAVDAPRDAAYPGGERALDQYLRSRISKALIESLPAAYTFRGTAMVEADGTVHEVTFSASPYPAFEQKIRRALQVGTVWQPAAAVFYETDGSQGLRAVEGGYAFQFTADPATVWTVLHNDQHDLLVPTPTKGGRLTLRWIGGSCGKAVQAVTIGERGADGITYINVSAGIEGDMCLDIRQRSQVIDLPPLPPGPYQLRIHDPPANATSHIGPYQYVAFTVVQ